MSTRVSLIDTAMVTHDPTDPQSSFVPSNWYELDESLNEFRAALARLHTDHPGQGESITRKHIYTADPRARSHGQRLGLNERTAKIDLDTSGR